MDSCDVEMPCDYTSRGRTLLNFFPAKGLSIVIKQRWLLWLAQSPAVVGDRQRGPPHFRRAKWGLRAAAGLCSFSRIPACASSSRSPSPSGHAFCSCRVAPTVSRHLLQEALGDLAHHFPNAGSTGHTPWRFPCPGLCLHWELSILRAGLALIPLGAPGTLPRPARGWGSVLEEGRKLLPGLSVISPPPPQQPQLTGSLLHQPACGHVHDCQSTLPPALCPLPAPALQLPRQTS